MTVSEDLPIKQGPALIALQWLAIVSSIVVAAGLAYVVAARYYLHWPATGVHTIVMVAAIWLYMTGALIASQSRQHLVVDYLSHRLKTPRARAIHRFCVTVLVLLIVVAFAYWTLRMFMWGSRFSTTMAELSIPVWVPQSAIGLNALGSLAYGLRDVYESWMALQRGEY
ncbi:TRAP transporter small permease subunit [Alcaligenes faecalis]|uniref:TRAP transporter small permease protein n=1 Tax=Alcaligenes ammonioxydans TaxID=2582914 RepID=A0ABX8STP7_9BURK|nr:TRAP transporter small permease subunit [Alcaligenes ammonioxydans]QXX78430.1 TRAP transporter small permease subunit [Alcaligenes ammonioxydans]